MNGSTLSENGQGVFMSIYVRKSLANLLARWCEPPMIIETPKRYEAAPVRAMPRGDGAAWHK